jgi:hypothetical protein
VPDLADTLLCNTLTFCAVPRPPYHVCADCAAHHIGMNSITAVCNSLPEVIMVIMGPHSTANPPTTTNLS